MNLNECLSLIAAGIACFALYRTHYNKQEDRRLEISRIYLERFDELVKQSERASQDEKKTINFFQRFWFLQQEQFLFWRKNLIDPDLFTIWMNYRIIEWKSDEFFGISQYRQHFKQSKTLLLPEFIEFIENFFEKEKFDDFSRNT